MFRFKSAFPFLSLEPVRPGLKEPLVVYLSGYLAVLLLAGFITWPLPSPIRISFFILVGIAALVPFGLGLWRVVFLHFTEEYEVRDGQVVISRGLLTKTVAAIPHHNIVEVQTILSFPLRFLSIGAVRISTNDGVAHLLHNIRNPGGFTENIRVLLKE